jgi:serine/threonine-protein kinase 24/25/MST4
MARRREKEELGPQHLELHEQIGKGSFGAVMRAVRTPGTPDAVLPDEPGEFAVKILDLEVADETLPEIHAEIKFMANCRHRNCVTYFGSFLKGHQLYIVMDFLGAGSLRAQLDGGNFLEEQIAIVCREVLQGLQYLHAGRWIHRDIKSANILLGLDGEVKLADFGVSATLINQKKRLSIVGSPYWMAPEIITSSGTDEKADIWSLGITCFELTRGLPPYADINPMQAMTRITKGEAVRLEATYSEPFRDFVALCLEKNPDKRSSATELLENSEFVLGAGPISDLKALPVRLAEWKAKKGESSKENKEAPPPRSRPHIRAEPEVIWSFETARLTPAQALFMRDDGFDEDATFEAAEEVFGIPGDDPLSLPDYASARWIQSRDPDVLRDFEMFLSHLEAVCD